MRLSLRLKHRARTGAGVADQPGSLMRCDASHHIALGLEEEGIINSKVGFNDGGTQPGEQVQSQWMRRPRGTGAQRLSCDG